MNLNNFGWVRESCPLASSLVRHKLRHTGASCVSTNTGSACLSAVHYAPTRVTSCVPRMSGLIIVGAQP